MGGFSNLIEHWDGERWSVSQPSTNKRFAYGNVLRGVAAASPSAAWAVGYRTRVTHRAKADGRPASPLIESWDGTAWRVDQTPSFSGHRAWLDAVVAFAADDVWAVGAQTVQPAHGRVAVYRTLIEHWDGSAWRVMPSPNIGPAADVRFRNFGHLGWEEASDNLLLGVAAVSANDVWAVGDTSLPIRKHNKRYYSVTYRVRPLTEHWNGTSWTVGPPVPSPAIRAGLTADRGIEGFAAVAAAPSGDLLAAGRYVRAWWLSGSVWTSAHLPRGTHLPNQPTTVTSAARDDAWVLGDSYPSTSGDLSAAASHWNGRQWLAAKLPASGGEIDAAAASAPDDIWAVGGQLAPKGKPFSHARVALHYTC